MSLILLRLIIKFGIKHFNPKIFQDLEKEIEKCSYDCSILFRSGWKSGLCKGNFKMNKIGRVYTVTKIEDISTISCSTLAFDWSRNKFDFNASVHSTTLFRLYLNCAKMRGSLEILKNLVCLEELYLSDCKKSVKFLPNTIRKLQLDGNSSIKFQDLPTSIQELKLYYDISEKIIDLKHLIILKTLHIRSVIDLTSLLSPNSVTDLDLSVPIDNIVFPPNLLKLNIGKRINFIDLPDSIINLSMKFAKTEIKFPTKLETLTICNISTPLTYLFNLNYITVLYLFDCVCKAAIIIPSSVKKLIVFDFDQLSFHFLGTCLDELYLNSRHDNISFFGISGNLVSIYSLRLETGLQDYSQLLSKKIFELILYQSAFGIDECILKIGNSNVERLILGEETDSSLETLPVSLRHLTVGNDRFNFRKFPIPDKCINLIELEINIRKNLNRFPRKFPNSLNWLKINTDIWDKVIVINELPVDLCTLICDAPIRTKMLPENLTIIECEIDIIEK